jgi:hypothetical protein
MFNSDVISCGWPTAEGQTRLTLLRGTLGARFISMTFVGVHIYNCLYTIVYIPIHVDDNKLSAMYEHLILQREMSSIPLELE